jgi:cell division septum initiation protein DivIVA
VSASEVSAFEPQPPESKVDMPEFVVVRRGVDRRQVEEWGKKLTSLIERERQRAEQAERALYRSQLEAKGTPSFTHLGAHAAGIIEEAGQSAEKMLLDAAERAQETVGMAEAEAAKIVEAAEGRAGEVEDAARQDAERLRAEGARDAEEVRKAAEGFRAQTEQKARSLLEDAREAAEALWQEAERKRVAVEGETRRLEALRERTHEQLARMYGHLESVLGEVRRGIGGTDDAGEEAGPA